MVFVIKSLFRWSCENCPVIISNDNDNLKRKQEKALKLVADIEKRCYELANYSKSFNKAGEEAVVANLNFHLEIDKNFAESVNA